MQISVIVHRWSFCPFFSSKINNICTFTQGTSAYTSQWTKLENFIQKLWVETKNFSYHIFSDFRNTKFVWIHFWKKYKFNFPSSMLPKNWKIMNPQLTLAQLGGADYAHLITTGTPRFSDLHTALDLYKLLSPSLRMWEKNKNTFF